MARSKKNFNPLPDDFSYVLGMFDTSGFHEVFGTNNGDYMLITGKLSHVYAVLERYRSGKASITLRPINNKLGFDAHKRMTCDSFNIEWLELTISVCITLNAHMKNTEHLIGEL